MKKLSFFLLIFVTISGLAVETYAQKSWVTKKLDDRISVKFPEEPNKVTKSGIDSYTLKAKDSTSFSSAIVDFKVIAGLDSATLAPIKDTKEFADQMKDGIAAQKTNYTFSDVVIESWKNYTTYSITGLDNSNKKKLSTHMVLIGSKMYTLSCLIPEGVDSKNTELFFDSITLINTK